MHEVAFHIAAVPAEGSRPRNKGSKLRRRESKAAKEQGQQVAAAGEGSSAETSTAAEATEGNRSRDRRAPPGELAVLYWSFEAAAAAVSPGLRP